MAVHGPYALIVCLKLYIPCFTGGHENGIFAKPCSGRYGETIGAHNLELVAVKMDRVVMHLDISKADPHRITAAYVQGQRFRVASAIDRKEVKPGLYKIQIVSARCQIAPG